MIGVSDTGIGIEPGKLSQIFGMFVQLDSEVEPVLDQVPQVRRRILVVDDNIDSAESLAMMLELSGHDVATAHDGVEAIELAREFRPHVALLDLGMPKLDGYEAARSIRRQSWGQKIMLVALTGWGQQEDKRRSREAGFDAHLVKPIDFDALEELVASSNGRVN